MTGATSKWEIIPILHASSGQERPTNSTTPLTAGWRLSVSSMTVALDAAGSRTQVERWPKIAAARGVGAVVGSVEAAATGALCPGGGEVSDGTVHTGTASGAGF